MEPNLRGARFVRQAQRAQEHAHQTRRRALHGNGITQDTSHNDISRDPARNYVTRGRSRNDNRHRPYPSGRPSRPNTGSAPRNAGPQGMPSPRPPPPPPPPPKPKKRRIYVNRDPPEGAWVPQPRGASDRPPLPLNRNWIFCMNCGRMHDPAVCRGPLDKRGFVNNCGICGGRHLVDDCPYKTEELLEYVLWYCRQGLPPFATRVDLAHLPAVEGQHVLAVMPCTMARALNFDAERRAERADECYEWRNWVGLATDPLLPSLQGRPSRNRKPAGIETELGETELRETELGEAELGETKSRETELRGEEQGRSPARPVDGQPWQGTIGRLRDYLGL
ncbi:hypothetical protein DL766_002355 [Monosporascus sp. MC13-8B]|uniref:Uncharacterized protein n=1 Tax=Monosporascus cannonballus TaxID=155416 RepID=A0ABY0HFW6_9PEZI|nr:hypothetical protein DL762_001598 [Monosporascus cannonballus]RYP00285.1 hypothetical protein DL763_000896 [Monosporascus cannonballus]RYP35702.1 hypothetical protein DL766_002355 [Monosporascus sp. MC13-8B]